MQADIDRTIIELVGANLGLTQRLQTEIAKPKLRRWRSAINRLLGKSL